jgi:hypothetical protein
MGTSRKTIEIKVLRAAFMKRDCNRIYDGEAGSVGTIFNNPIIRDVEI